MSSYFRRLCLSISMLVLSSGMGFVNSAIAKPNANPTRSNRPSRPKPEKPRTITFNPPASSGSPTLRSTDGSRNGNRCPSQLPQVVTYSQGFQTSLKRPTFWVYLPYTVVDRAADPQQNEISQNAWMQFIVRDYNSRKILHEEKRIAYPRSSPGFANLALPESKQLSPNVTYEWVVEIHCEPRSTVMSKPGLIKYLDSVTKSTGNLPTFEQIEDYGQNGLWYETIDGLFTLKQQAPNDQQLSENLKQLIELTGISTQSDRIFYTKE
ncbi:DUF928 domain-containing protein [Leptolyngbya sp. GGD]|uniref:DUF928 domain-containing protein n=1 Tax=Leptolyngbya sp. GGD TaxID=2997907 RepID=UPI00227CAFC5|nr:DUF928 domain-containing protein [Leptolyngbya sp. GGD]MCY6494272.1 DUF928 domain-containing protein [Leptolyngbya sp. GGD]